MMLNRSILPLCLALVVLVEGRSVGGGSRGPGAGQSSKSSAPRAVTKPARAYQVEVRLHVPPDADKGRVIEWVGALRAAGVTSASEVSGPATTPRKDAKELPAVRLAAPGRVVADAELGTSGNLRIGTELFRTGERTRLQAFIQKLRDEGPPDADPAAPLWGLDEARWDALLEALKPSSEFDLQGQSLTQFVSDVHRRTKLRIQVSPAAEKQAQQAGFHATTGRISLGAAMAYVLSTQDFVFEPRQSASGDVSLVVMRAAEAKRPWPVGLPPEQFPGTVAPRLMATARFQTTDMPLSELLAVLARQLDMDVLLDESSLAEKKIDPAQLRSTVQITGGTFESAIRKTLAPLELKHELRIDEASRPFLWITASEPTAPTPKKKR